MFDPFPEHFADVNCSRLIESHWRSYENSELNYRFSCTIALAFTNLRKGLRIGEAIAIKWADFEGDVLRISRRIYEGKADTTKTDNSERSLPIPSP